jgi:chemotaxis family two-component system response regulator Rcp1
LFHHFQEPTKPGLSQLQLALEAAPASHFEVLPLFDCDWEQEGILMEILLVDDNPADVRMVREGLREALPHASLSVTPDGVEAIRFLRREGHYSRAPRPDLIILDLRLPKKSGFDVLVEIKTDPALANIPVVVQSSSEEPIDIQRAYSLHANCYITKPAGFDEFSRTMRVLADFWVTVVKLPDGGTQWKTN